MGVLAQVVRDVKAVAVDIYAVVVGQLGALYVFFRFDLRAIVTNLADGDFLQALGGFKDTVLDLAIPHYANFGGRGWGLSEKYNAWGPPLNQVDAGSYWHDFSCETSCRSGVWTSDTFSNDPAYLPAGPFGMAYQLLGLIPFTIAGELGK